MQVAPTSTGVSVVNVYAQIAYTAQMPNFRPVEIKVKPIPPKPENAAAFAGRHRAAAKAAEELQNTIAESIRLNRPVLIDAVADGEVYANMSQSM